MFYHYKVRQVFTLFNSIARKLILESTHQECPPLLAMFRIMHKKTEGKVRTVQFIACKFTLVSTHEEYYPSFGNVSYKAQKDRGQMKKHRDSMVG